uniref:Uncharacterized protein n=1 Tax=Leviviridae sp. TaxID=2027243 RepID=A0A514D846_9VIRU|nr:MAG: hypothetical protein H3BulkL161825e955_000002 [Leviviridae sp.]
MGMTYQSSSSDVYFLPDGQMLRELYQHSHSGTSVILLVSGRLLLGWTTIWLVWLSTFRLSRHRLPCWAGIHSSVTKPIEWIRITTPL